MPQSASQATLTPGTVLTKRYRIEQLIGSGGYASVYRASDLTFGYDRAIKEVSDQDTGVRNQFRLEAELLINSRHPNIPHGYHLIEDMGRLYLVMDFVQGKDLEELLNDSLTKKQRPLDEAQALRWAIDICGALDEMHNLKVPVIHRDIKPANIKIMPDGRPVLIDFGLAKLQQRNGPTLTAAQGVSPGFAPPEQYMAKGRTDARTDIYGLGATLYACLTGKDPPEAPGRLLAQTGAGGAGMSLVPARKMNPRVSEDTDRAVLKALELSPGNRQQSARQLRDELEAALRKLTGAAPAGAGAPATVPAATAGAPCPRCGAQNRADAARCVHCGGPLRSLSELNRQTGTPQGVGLDGTGKRPVPGAPGRTNAKMPTVGSAAKRPSATADDDAEQRTGRQPLVGNQRSGKQPAVAGDLRTGKQKAIAAQGDTLAGTGTMLALPSVGGRGAAAGSPLGNPGNQGNRAPRGAGEAARGGVAVAEQTATTAGARQGGWIRLGTTPLTRFGKTMLVLASVEVFWGLLVLVLGGVAIAFRNQPLPKVQLAIGWLIVVVLGSILGAQAISRPVFRRGRLTTARRWLQGIGLVLYSVAVHGVALWGATIFASQQGNETLALISFILFGVNVFVVGVLAVINTLG